MTISEQHPFICPGRRLACLREIVSVAFPPAVRSFDSYSRFPTGTLHVENSVHGRYMQVKAAIAEAAG